MSNLTKQLFSGGHDSTLSEVPADQGHGGLGEWPPDGLHANYIIGMNVAPQPFRQRDAEEIEGSVTQFTYRLIEDPDHDEPLTWVGAPFNLPLNPDEISVESSKIRYRIEMERLKGHLKTILGRDVTTDLAVAMEQTEGMIRKSDVTVPVMVACSTNARGYKTEKLQSRIGS